jgi:AcrR family transcriptional regulator
MSVADGPRSLKDRQREERERLILEAAEELLAEKGYHEMSIDEIATRVGVSKGTVYLHFPSKEELVLAYLGRGMRRFIRSVDVVLMSAATPSERLRSLIELIYSQSYRECAQFFTSFYESPDLRNRLLDRKYEFHRQWESVTQRVSAVFDEGKALGVFDSTIPTAVMASVFWGLLTPRTCEHLQEREQRAVEEMVSHLSQFFFKGLAAGESQERKME